MDIHRHNYEAYLLDLMEGRLTEEETQRLRDFLRLNPDCAEGLNEHSVWSLEPSNTVFEGKSCLKKDFPDHSTPLTSSNFDMFSIARLEGDLSPEQEADHDRLIVNDKQKMKEWKAWQQTRLASETITYHRKNTLLKSKQSRSRVIWISVVSAAASLALIITLIRSGPDLTEASSSGPDRLLEAVADPVESNVSDDPVPAVPAEDPVILASEPAILSIKKHQDPPELTGRDQMPEQIGVKTDSISQSVQEEKIQSGALKLAVLHTSQASIVEAGQYDQIGVFEILPAYSRSETQTLARLSEKGLKQTYKDYVKEKDLSLLTIASAGVDGINRLTGSDLSLNLSRNEQGEVSGFRFRSKRLSASSPVDKTD